jgi:branched-chain amino acid transport system ATP-binding protein
VSVHGGGDVAALDGDPSVRAGLKPATTEEVILRLDGVTRRFGGVCAVDDLSMRVSRRSIHGLIGPNGSGKTTTFNLIAGEMAPSNGAIFFKGRNITGSPPHRIARLGIARTFQATDLFPEFSVAQNLMIAAHLRAPMGFWSSVLRTPRYATARGKMWQRVDAILERLRLIEMRDMIVRDLPHRQQKAVALANALATDPELLMLDEPAAGLTHQEIEDIMALYRSLCDEGRTILIVEHNMRTVMTLCDRITVLNHGRKIAEGTPSEVAKNELVLDAYLGKGGSQVRVRSRRGRGVAQRS